jgi:hypothetical protein
MDPIGGILLCILFWVTSYVGYWKYKRILNHWIQIEEVEVHSYYLAGRNPSFLPMAKFSYTIEGQTYTTETHLNNGVATSEKNAEREIKRLQRCDSLKIYVNPKNRYECCQLCLL